MLVLFSLLQVLLLLLVQVLLEEAVVVSPPLRSGLDIRRKGLRDLLNRRAGRQAVRKTIVVY